MNCHFIKAFARIATCLVSTVAVGAMALAPAQAAECWSTSTVAAAKVRQLDVMLMVGSLRCRAGADDFRIDYDSFLTHHHDMLGVANRTILSDLGQSLGPVGALAALDQASVRMANHYGDSAQFGCHELKMVAAALAQGPDSDIPHAADVLVGQDVIEAACDVRVVASGN